MALTQNHITENGFERKKANQDAFISGETSIIVATSAFGMGIDKKDVGMVIHYDISDSLKIIYRKLVEQEEI
jgi:superfamily II DNA helicase RecQ